MSGKNDAGWLRGRNVAGSSKWHQEILRFREVVISVGNSSIPLLIDDEDPNSTSNPSYSGCRFASKTYFANKSKNNLRLESTPMIW